ncbi:MAG: DUF2088 domain-containing protein [Fidelibacterota bacterium]|nr:MAG: DUF2088 domain-containing protein [Candidatus Neomarinimicrobiota bacterium]
MHNIVTLDMKLVDDSNIAFPVMYRVRQRLDNTSIEDIAGTIYRKLSNRKLEDQVRSGQSVAVAVGSRGIHDLPTIVSTVIDHLSDLRLKPYIIPAMGSHGGATAKGQAEVLSKLGITESSVGAPVISNMETVSLGQLESGANVYIAQDAIEADHLIVINRVKRHTVLRGEVESGLCKMLAVGCGKQQGASNMHKYDLAASIIPAARMILEQVPVLCGLAILENALERTHTIKAVLPHEFVETDRALLQEAKRLFPRIPLDDLDILIVDEMGKNISGAGIDPNVVGFWRRDGGPRQPDYRTLIVLDLTPQSYGNAMAIGMVDLTTHRVIDKIDPKVTYTNAITSGILSGSRLPMALENDRAVLATALYLVPQPEQVRIARIVNTLSLSTFWATEAVLSELHEQAGITVDDTPLQLEFDTEGRLQAFGQ